jgi:flagellar hook-length control protein FliK
MRNEPVTNFLMGDATGLAREMEQAKAARKAEGGAGTFTEEVRKVMAANSDVKKISAGISAFTKVASDKNQRADERKVNEQNSGERDTDETDAVVNNEILAYTDIAINNETLANTPLTADSENHATPLIDHVAVDGVEVVIETAAETVIKTSDIETLPANAHEIIAKALARISEILNLPPEAAADLESGALDFGVESLEQFADILWAINKVINLLENANPTTLMENFANAGFQPFNTTDDPAAVTAALRKEKFNLEFGLRVVGAYEEVAEKMAERHDVNTVTGINQAANPDDLGMSTSDLARVFSSLIKEELTSAMERVRKITSGQEEMTELEKAAIRLGAVKSEILKAALDRGNSLWSFDVESIKSNAKAGVKVDTDVAGANVNNSKVDVNTVVNTNINNSKADVNTAVNTNVNNSKIDVNTAVDTNVNSNKVDANTVTGTNVDNKIDTETNTEIRVTAKAVKKAAADNFDLPISAKESAGKAKMVENIEAANRMASRSVESVTTRIIAAESSVEIPVSAAESMNKKVADNNGVNRPVNVELLTTKTAATDNTVQVPVSAAESVNKKSADGDGNNNSNSSEKSANPVQATAKIIVANDGGVEIPVSVSESTNGKKSAGGKSQHAATDKASSEAAAAASKITLGEELKANVDARHQAAVKAEQAAQNTADASGKSESASSGHNGSRHVDVADRLPFGGAASVIMENSEELTVEAEISDDPQGVGEVKIESAKDVAMRETEKTATAFSRLDNEAIIRQLTDRMNNALRAGVQEIRMTLRPEALGEVRMSIRMQGDMVVAQMQVENKQVKSIIESNLQSLKDELAKQNINLGGFSVDVSSDSDRSPRQIWQEMAEAAELRRFNSNGEAADGSIDVDEADSLATAPGSDTGRRFGNNTFEYFI